MAHGVEASSLEKRMTTVKAAQQRVPWYESRKRYSKQQARGGGGVYAQEYGFRKRYSKQQARGGGGVYTLTADGGEAIRGGEAGGKAL